MKRTPPTNYEEADAIVKAAATKLEHYAARGNAKKISKWQRRVRKALAVRDRFLGKETIVLGSSAKVAMYAPGEAVERLAKAMKREPAKFGLAK